MNPRRNNLALLSVLARVSGFLLVVFAFEDFAVAKVKGDVTQVGDATHFEFSGLSQWDYQLEKTGSNTITLQLPALDGASRTRLQSWQGHHIQSIKVTDEETQGKVNVEFVLSTDAVESFDYLTDDPSRLIVDFFRQEEKPSKPAEAAKSSTQSQGKRLPEKKSQVAGGANRPKRKAKGRLKGGGSGSNKANFEHKGSGRRPAGSEVLRGEEGTDGSQFFAPGNTGAPERGLFDAGDPDYQRFRIRSYEIREEAIIASRQNIYIRFPMLRMPSGRLTELLKNRPEYVIRPRETQENKEARLLLTLYTKDRPGAFLKTYGYFLKAYKDSDYEEIVRHLAAEIYFDMWREKGHRRDLEKAIKEYTLLLNKYPESVLAERTQKLLLYTALERKDGLETVRLAKKFLDQFPNSGERDWVKKALAEGFLRLNKFSDALSVYNDLEKNFVKDEASAEATYRKGDVHFANKKYKKAIKAYKDAIKRKPGYQNVFPNAYYNIAESQFWLGNYKDSLENYLTYVRLFPHHSHGSYALTRVGELLSILGADQSRSMGAFLESYFRFRNSEGARVARVRLLSQRMRGMKEKELRKSIDELEKIADASKLPRIHEFITIMTAEGFHNRKQFNQALDRLIDYYQQNPTSVNKSLFQRKILMNIADEMKRTVDDQRYMDALQLNSRYSTTWLRRSDRMDIPYMVAQAFEEAGVFSEALQSYRKTLLKLKTIKGTAEEKERRVIEHLPHTEEVLLRMASSSLKQRNYAEAEGFLREMGGDKNLSPAQRVERRQVIASIAEKQGQTDVAISELEKLVADWKDQPEHLASVYLRLAELRAKKEEYKKSLASLVKFEEAANKSTNVEESLVAKGLGLKGDVLLQLGRSVESVETYLQLLSEFEDKRPLQSVRYKTGMILFDKGDLRGASKVWSALNEQEGQMYRRLANEKLSEAEWKGEYKKYIERIPAAKSLK